MVFIPAVEVSLELEMKYVDIVPMVILRISQDKATGRKRFQVSVSEASSGLNVLKSNVWRQLPNANAMQRKRKDPTNLSHADC